MTFENLSEQLICNGLSNQEVTILVANCLPSTNDHLMDILHSNQNISHKTALFAEMQTHGKGRQGRSWISLPGNILMSLYWEFNSDLERLYGLSLVVGISIARALQENGLKDVQLKWPNDIYWHGYKMGGVLIETKPLKPGVIATVIGLGLNLVDDTDIYKQNIDQKAVALEAALGYKISRNKLAADLLRHLDTVLTKFAQAGFNEFISQWKELDSKIVSTTSATLDAAAKIMYADVLKDTGEMAERLKAHVSKT